jgi:hypothetical protein
MTASRDIRTSSPDVCPGQISWDYDRAEIIADGAVHAIGVCLGLIGAVTLVVITIGMERIEVTPILVYVIGLDAGSLANCPRKAFCAKGRACRAPIRFSTCHVGELPQSLCQNPA